MGVHAARLAGANRAGHEPVGVDPDLPEVVGVGESRGDARHDHGARIADGQASLKGKIWRLGHIGYYDTLDLLGLVGAMEETLVALGWECEPGAGPAAFQRTLIPSPQAADA